MKIALIGYGKMGRALDELAPGMGCEVVARVRSREDIALIKEADLCLEFTRPESAVENIKQCAYFKKNVVVGTTGWNPPFSELEELTQEIALLYAPNFSLGIFLWMQLVEHSAKLFNAFEMYDVGSIEVHHEQKLDRPSGTAAKMAKVIEEKIARVDKLQVESVRVGTIPGTHTLIYDSLEDSITLTHKAHNRNGFAKGALMAAKWLEGKKGFYTLEDMWKGV